MSHDSHREGDGDLFQEAGSAGDGMEGGPWGDTEVGKGQEGEESNLLIEKGPEEGEGAGEG